MDILVKKINESYCHLELERGIAQELNDYFSYFMPGYQYSPKYRAKLWSGKIYLAKILPNGNIEFPVGILSQLETFCEDRNYTLEYNFTENQQFVDESYIRKYIEELNIHSNNKKIELRDYQIEAVIEALTNKRRVLLSPTSCLDPNTEIEVELDQDMVDFLSR